LVSFGASLGHNTVPTEVAAPWSHQFVASQDSRAAHIHYESLFKWPEQTQEVCQLQQDCNWSPLTRREGCLSAL